jgi:hypothetical protein
VGGDEHPDGFPLRSGPPFAPKGFPRNVSKD